MKKKYLGILCLVLAVGFILSGCGCFYQAVKGETPPPPPPKAAVTPPPAKVEVPVTPPPPPVVAGLQDVYFDFDKYNIRPDASNALKANTNWFKANAGKKVRIEGNCDERGTVEYNLALGQRRADSTKSYLVQLGVDGKALETVSYGKERPVCTEKNEACWAKNRRAHFLVLP